jgi:hypothetical protein
MRGTIRCIALETSELVEVDDVYDAMGDEDGWELAMSNEHAADLILPRDVRVVHALGYLAVAGADDVVGGDF